MTEAIDPNKTAQQYQIQGLARDAMVGAGIDFTGDTYDAEGKLVSQTPLEAVMCMSGLVQAKNPEGYQRLQNALLEV